MNEGHCFVSSRSSSQCTFAFRHQRTSCARKMLEIVGRVRRKKKIVPFIVCISRGTRVRSPSRLFAELAPQGHAAAHSAEANECSHLNKFHLSEKLVRGICGAGSSAWVARPLKNCRTSVFLAALPTSICRRETDAWALKSRQHKI